MKTLISVILILISAALISSQEIRIRNKRVEREIDLTSQFSRHSVAIEVENFGSTSVHDLQFTVQEPLASKLALFDVLEERTGEKLVSTNKGTKQQGKHRYRSSNMVYLANIFVHYCHAFFLFFVLT